MNDSFYSMFYKEPFIPDSFICRSNNYWVEIIIQFIPLSKFWILEKHLGLKVNKSIQIWQDYKTYHCTVMNITENLCLCIQDCLAPSRCSLNGKCFSFPAYLHYVDLDFTSRGSSQCWEIWSAAFSSLSQGASSFSLSYLTLITIKSICLLY